MSGETASVLQITPEGYKAALDAEPYGFLAELKWFRVASTSMPGNPSLPWGDQVYYGQINDYTVTQGNTILLTCVVPPEVPDAEIDSMALYIGDDGIIFAQGMLRSVRQVRANTGTYIYAYINAPEPAELVEATLQHQSVFPQVQDYADLPPANIASRFEYVINNGHCGKRDEQPEFLPMMVMVSSDAPNTVLFPPNEPFLDPDVGTLVPGTYKYQVTALNGAGESLPSPLHTISLVALPTPVSYLEQGYGELASGTYYYQVVAKSPGGGRTVGSSELSLAVSKLATPGAPSGSGGGGGLNAGTYHWSIVAVGAQGTTIAGLELTGTVADDSGMALTWAAVTDAYGYRVYRRSGSDPTAYFVAETSALTYYDWGLPADVTKESPTVATDCGVLVKWDKVEGAVEYEVYGRNTGGTKQRLVTLLYDQFQWFDTGSETPSGPTVSVANDTATGVEIKWTAVDGATDYYVYGREEGLIGLIGGTMGNTSFIDDGTQAPGAAPPTENLTSAVEWQLVDGTLVYRGGVDDASDTTFTLYTITERDWDLAMVTVTGGTGQFQTRHIKYVGEGTFQLLDKNWDVVLDVTSTIAIWAGPGCCGGGPCPDVDLGALYPDTTPIPTAPPQWSWLGVHICGKFLGQPSSEEAQTSGINFTWDANTAPELIRTAGMDHLFADENGRTAYDLPINNVVVTPHGNRFPYGEFSSTAESAANAVRFTLDAIAVAPGIRLVVYSQPNFSGPVLLDVVGPIYIVNWVWRDRAAFSYALDDSVWKGTAGQIIPAANRYWSDDTRLFATPQNLHSWRTSSFQVIRTWL